MIDSHMREDVVELLILTSPIGLHPQKFPIEGALN
jgi:hypothetical protein